MKYNNRQDFINASASEKNTLIFLYPAQRLLIWNNEDTNIWSKEVDFLVEKVKKGDVFLTKAASLEAVSEGTSYFYDLNTNVLTIWSDSENPDLDNIIVFHKLCFANKTVKISHNFFEDGEIVEFEGRVQSNPGFKSILSTDSVALVSGGTLSLENNDGFFNTIYKTLVWENKLVEVYSYNKDMPITETKILYRGFIENKSFSSTDFNLSVKDMQRQLDEKIIMNAFNSSDFVDPKYYSTYKRTIYGKALGLETRSISQIINTNYFNEYPMVVSAYIQKSFSVSGEVIDTFGFPPGVNELEDLNPWYVNYTLQQTLPKNIYSIRILGVVYNYKQIVQEAFGAGTKYIIKKGFLSESGTTPPVGTNSYTILDKNGISRTFTQCYAPGQVEILPLLETSPEFYHYQLEYNRSWSVSGHRLSSPSNTITAQTELNRFYVNNSQDFNVGDRIKINGHYYTIAQISGNMIRTTSASLTGLNIGLSVNREAVQWIYIDNTRVPSSEIVSQTNDLTNMSIKISKIAELMARQLVYNNSLFQVFKVDYNTFNPYITFFFHKDSKFDKSFKEGDLIATTGTELKSHLIITKIQTFKYDATTTPIDTIMVSVRVIDKDLQDLTWVSSLKTIVDGTPNTAFGFTKTNEYKPLTNDDSLVVDCYGKTVDLTANGKMLKTGVEIIKDLIQSSSTMKNYISNSSFTTVSLENEYAVSIALPYSINDKSKPSIKDVVNKINKTLKTSLYLDNDLNIAIKSLNAIREEEQFIITDSDVISWSIIGKSNDLYTQMETSFDFRDYYIEKKQKDNLKQTNSSQFVEDFEISGKTLEQDMYLIDPIEVQELSERILYGKTLTENVIKIKGAFSLVDLEVGQQVVVDIKKIFKNIYDQNRLIGMITSITRTGDSVELEVSDLGNLFDRIAVISADDTVEHSVDDIELRINSSYITDENGLIDSGLDTLDNNIIG